MKYFIQFITDLKCCFLAAIFVCIFFCSYGFAHYASIKPSKANVRYGPGVHYPLKFTYLKSNIPVKVLESFENWNQIEDIDGEKGWVKSNLITKKKYSTIKSLATGYKKMGSSPVVKIEDGVTGHVKKCKQNWCYIQVEGYKVWVEKDLLWGLD